MANLEQNVAVMLAEFNERMRRIEAYIAEGRDKRIKAGQLVVVDENDIQQIRLGLLAGGSYGLETLQPDGTWVTNEQLAFGLAAGRENIAGQRTAGSFGDLAAYFGSAPTVGPEVTVEIGPSQRAIVMVGAIMTIGNTVAIAGSAATGYEVSGDSTLAAEVGRSLFKSSPVVSGTGHTSEVIRASAVDVLGPAELNQGSATFTMKYQGTTGTTQVFDNRHIVVIPF